MSPQFAREPDSPLILAVGFSSDEYRFVQSVLAATRFVVQHAGTCRNAMAQARKEIAVVLSAAELPDGTWRDLIAGLRAVASPPPLIVVSRLADECLWAEVLNLGGYDLLLKPLDCREMQRVIEAAARSGARPALL